MLRSVLRNDKEEYTNTPSKLDQKMSSKKNPQIPVRPAKLSHRSTLSLQKTDIIINCYDLLPVNQNNVKIPKASC